MQMYVMSLVDVAAHLTQQSTNSLDLGEQADNEHGGVQWLIKPT
ncbi:Uncharacterised protein [Salmonella enterica subsp. enterica]|uniref:Uncharacterized protein n=1 Tax=Salmonella enterica I TaxID=59201 RepID=A0A379V2K7_SALET|nr:Uncharacterised protein [Salmonella enterica subsp. enterica]